MTTYCVFYYRKRSPDHEGVVQLLMPVSFVRSLERQTSNEIKTEGHVTRAVPTELLSSNESLASNTDNELLGNETPLNARCHSCDDILSASTHTPTSAVPMVTVSRSQGTTADTLDNDRDAVMDEASTSLKRASSDTMLNSTESTAVTIEDRLTRFTGKLFHNLLQVGKSLKQRSSPIKHAIQSDNLESQGSRTETEAKDTNEDSDSSLTKWQTKKLRFRKNVFGSRSTLQKDTLEEEAEKKKKREQSKSKIVIV